MISRLRLAGTCLVVVSTLAAYRWIDVVAKAMPPDRLTHVGGIPLVDARLYLVGAIVVITAAESKALRDNRSTQSMIGVTRVAERQMIAEERYLIESLLLIQDTSLNDSTRQLMFRVMGRPDATLGWIGLGSTRFGSHDVLLMHTSVIQSALLFVGLTSAALSSWSWVRQLVSRKQGRCVRCGYLLIGAISDICPECGWATADRKGRLNFSTRSDDFENVAGKLKETRDVGPGGEAN